MVPENELLFRVENYFPVKTLRIRCSSIRMMPIDFGGLGSKSLPGIHLMVLTLEFLSHGSVLTMGFHPWLQPVTPFGVKVSAISFSRSWGIKES